MSRKKIAIALSGGVDSTAAALLLRDKYDLTGFFMRLDQPDYEQQLIRVTHIAKKLSIPLTVLDLRKEFQLKILEYFSISYAKGLTPNPCMICNKEIKFGFLLDAMLNGDCELATSGHYARLVQQDGLQKLYKGYDKKKDQSYFLARLTQQQLANILFPLGGLEKQQIYDFVNKHGFTDFEGKESQDVCFLQDGKVADYLEQVLHLPSTVGNIIDTNGKILGKHRGVHHYTIGQRRGLGISDVSPYYVVGLKPETNEVIVGKNEQLMRHKLILDNIHWISATAPDLTKKFSVRIRYTHPGATARIIPENNLLRVQFDTAQRGITPGQFGVIYDDDELLGSGVIQ